MKKLFKELHKWLSIPLGLLISVTCFSGAMLVFETEISEALRPRYYRVVAEGEPLAIDELIARVEPTLGEGQEITGITIFEDAERSYKVNLSQPKHAATYVNQYSGEVLGSPERLGFFRTMFRLHRWFMDSRPADGGIFWGKMIVGVSTLLMVVIIITGLIVWIPKHRKSLANRMTIKLRSGRHRLLYDLHVAGGFYAAALLLVMALTGLTWSFTWYRDGLYALFGIEQSEPKGGGEAHNKSRVHEDVALAASTYLHWQQVYESVAAECDTATQITLAKGSASVKYAQWGNQRASDKYLFDNATGEMMGVNSYESSSKMSKMRGWLYTLHVGSWGGLFTRIMWFLAAMLGATLPLTGYYLWIRRKIVKHRACSECRDRCSCM